MTSVGMAVRHPSNLTIAELVQTVKKIPLNLDDTIRSLKPIGVGIPNEQQYYVV